MTKYQLAIKGCNDGRTEGSNRKGINTRLEDSTVDVGIYKRLNQCALFYGERCCQQMSFVAYANLMLRFVTINIPSQNRMVQRLHAKFIKARCWFQISEENSKVFSRFFSVPSGDYRAKSGEPVETLIATEWL